MLGSGGALREGVDVRDMQANLFRGWGVDFRILLDDDRAGRSAKKKYLEEYCVSANEVVTIADVNSDFSGREFEFLYKQDVVAAVKKKFSASKASKKLYSLFFQELNVKDSGEVFFETENAINTILKWSDEQFNFDLA